MRELANRLVLGHHPALEPLARLDDGDHSLLEVREVLGRERNLDAEVVVEAVLDGRADAELGLGEGVLHCLRQHVRGRMTQDCKALG